MFIRKTWLVVGLLLGLAQAGSSYGFADKGLLFSVSGEAGLKADYAKGESKPIYASGFRAIDGKFGKGISLDDNLSLAWSAPANIYARQGTIAFYFKPRRPLGRTPFPIFRVSQNDGTSWDMQFARIDWNGQGFEAFVTDTGLSRIRVSSPATPVPAPNEWVHIAFGWDETEGIKLWVNGALVAQNDTPANLDQGLWGFGPFQRIVAPWQVHSMYNYRRSGDLDQIRIFDHRLTEAEIKAEMSAMPLSEPVTAPEDPPEVAPISAKTHQTFLHRYGWDRPDESSLVLKATDIVIRKVEFSRTRDVLAKAFKGTDGIAETTWPGVYNLSAIKGRHDYFELPDWNVYSQGGKTYELTLPDEAWNHIEISGPAYGVLRKHEEADQRPFVCKAKRSYAQRP